MKCKVCMSPVEYDSPREDVCCQCCKLKREKRMHRPMSKYIVNSEHAAKIHDWLVNRGGVAIWKSVDLSDPGKTWTTPANQADGSPATKPSWQAADQPDRIVTDPAEVEVHVLKEAKRFRVGVRRGAGYRFELTAAASRRLRNAIDKADCKYCDGRPHASYDFDYDTQEAVIFVPDQILSLDDYLAKAVD